MIQAAQGFMQEFLSSFHGSTDCVVHATPTAASMKRPSPKNTLARLRPLSSHVSLARFCAYFAASR